MLHRARRSGAGFGWLYCTLPAIAEQFRGVLPSGSSTGWRIDHSSQKSVDVVPGFYFNFTVSRGYNCNVLTTY